MFFLTPKKVTEKTDDGFKSQMQPWPYIKGDKKDKKRYKKDPINFLTQTVARIYSANS